MFHNISYYAPEMRAFGDVGLPEYWRAYMAYRSAPMGAVAPAVVTATFYNFAPRVVEAGLPSAWEQVSPAGAIELRNSCMDEALRRALGELASAPGVSEAAELALMGIEGTDYTGRALFGAHLQLPHPAVPHMLLWHACTLWREHRGDGHNIALAAAGIDGVECHVLLAGKGIASAEVIQKIRGWTADEWNDATARLRRRRLIEPDGALTTAGQMLRAEIETHTDELAAEPRERLGADRTARLIELLDPMVTHLVDTGAVAGRWPPPKPPA